MKTLGLAIVVFCGALAVFAQDYTPGHGPGHDAPATEWMAHSVSPGKGRLNGPMPGQDGELSAQERKKRLDDLLPTSGFEKMANQPEHPETLIGGHITSRDKREIMMRFPFLLGETGILASRRPDRESYEVTDVRQGSPAEGEILKGDIIVGAQGKKFPEFKVPEGLAQHYPNPQMGQAIEDAHMNGGRMRLKILRMNRAKEIPLQLRPLGGFGDNFPGDNLKSEWLVELNCRIFAAKQQPDGSWRRGYPDAKATAGNDSKVTAMVALVLMSTGNDKYEPHIKKSLEYMLTRTNPSGYLNWHAGYMGLYFGEYYLRYRDERAKAALQRLVDTVFPGYFFYNGSYGYGHTYIKGNYGGSGINVCSGLIYLVGAMAKKCGVKIPENLADKFILSIERIAPQGYVQYTWSAGKQEPVNGDPGKNQHSPRTGIMAVAYRLLGGSLEQHRKMINFLDLNSQYGHVTEGHASGGSLGWFWGSIALCLDDTPEAYREHMRRWSWFINLNAMHDGGFWMQPSAVGEGDIVGHTLGPHFRSSGTLLMLNAHKRNLFITGKKELLPQYGHHNQVVNSTIHSHRHDRRVEVAEAISLLGGQSPRELKVLLGELKKVDLDKDVDSYETEVSGIYRKHLKLAVSAVLSLRAKNKTKAAYCLLGINPQCRFNAARTLWANFWIAPVNFGTLEYELKIEGSKLKNPFVHKGTVNTGTSRATTRSNHRLGVKGDFTGQMTFTCNWEGLRIGGTEQFEIKNKDLIFDDDNVVVNGVCGPYEAKIICATYAGALRVELADGVLSEFILPKEGLQFKVKGKSMDFPKYLKRSKAIGLPPGKRCRFTYNNKNGNTTMPTCLMLDLLD